MHYLFGDSEAVNQFIKYLIEGVAVTGLSMYLSKNRLSLRELFLIGLTAAATFWLLDVFAPSVGSGTRQGAGFGLGARLVGFEPFQGDEELTEPDGLGLAPQEVSEDGGGPHLVDDQYARKALEPGYRESVKPANSSKYQRYLSFNGPVNPEQVEGFSNPPMGNIEDPAKRREPGALHSGDLVNIMSDGRILQRGTVDSQIIFDKPLPEVLTNLAKVRFVLKDKHSNSKQQVIKYGDSVLLMHNSFVNNRNKSFLIKYGSRLQSHQEGPMFRVFKLFHGDDQSKKGPVKFSEPVLIARGDRSDDKVYLKIESDKSVTANAVAAEADKMVLQLNRVFEYGNKNLCIGPNEMLFP